MMVDIHVLHEQGAGDNQRDQEEPDRWRGRTDGRWRRKIHCGCEDQALSAQPIPPDRSGPDRRFRAVLGLHRQHQPGYSGGKALTLSNAAVSSADSLQRLAPRLSFS